MNPRFLTAACLTLLLTAAGCGNKGPLYLPQRPAATKTESAKPSSVPANDDNKGSPQGAKP